MITFDVVVAADLRRADSDTDSLSNDIRRLASAGHGVALMHLPGEGVATDHAFAPQYRDILARRIAHLVLPADEARAKLVVVHSAEAVPQHPFTESALIADKTLVIARQPPKRWARVRYDVGSVTERLTAALGSEPTWAPVDPATRQSLVKNDSGIPMTPFEWSDANKRAERIAELADAKPRTKPARAPRTEDVPLPDRSHGVLIIDITGDDRPDILLPAVRREASHASRPRIVATSAAQAAQHAGDLAVETLPRTLSQLGDEERRGYVETRIRGLVRDHAPDIVIVLDDFSTGVDVRRLLSGCAAHVWLVQPEGPVGLPSIDHDLGKRVADALPPGWVASPIAGEFDEEHDGGSSAVSAPWTSRYVATLQRWITTAAKAATRAIRRLRPSPHPPQPTALIVAPDVHADPAAAVRAITRRQHETNAFRAAILAPPDWEPVASQHGVPIETLIPEPTWASIYGGGWNEYVRQRVRDAGAVFAASTIVFTDNVSDDTNIALDVIEASVDAQAG